MNLSPRLKMVADMVRPGTIVADVGTDHAYLPVYLLQNNISPRAIASDLRPGPLKNATKSVVSAGLTEKIDLRLSDGLDNIAAGEAQEIIIAGMGGELIVDLLKRTAWLCDSDKRLILQPMTHAEDVRKYLCNNGFKILFEQACFEAQRVYIAMCACFQDAPMQVSSNAYYYIGELPACGGAAAKMHIKKIRNRLTKRAGALVASGANLQEAEQLQTIAKKILEVSVDE